MSDTPRTDAIIEDDDTLGHKLARLVVLSTKLERELETAVTIAHRAEHRANQLESELAAALQAIKFARSHLWEATTRGIPTDDTIIANHIEAAYTRLKEVANAIDDAMREEKP
jgi:hypothetical protein